MFDSRIAGMMKNRNRRFWRFRCKACCIKFASERGKQQHLRLSGHQDIFDGWPDQALKAAPVRGRKG